jgi:hypothetical protein
MKKIRTVVSSSFRGLASMGRHHIGSEKVRMSEAELDIPFCRELLIHEAATRRDRDGQKGGWVFEKPSQCRSRPSPGVLL